MPAGERGEIVMRGPKVFKGYWRDPDATAAAFAGGWFHTGDIGVRDDDGYLFIVDRLKDMIVSGGENIASSEVERVLYEHDAVLEAAVVGRPDDRWGEVPVAFVVLRPGRDRDGGRAPRALPRPAGALQGPQGDHLPRRAAPQPVRQGAQARAPRMSRDPLMPVLPASRGSVPSLSHRSTSTPNIEPSRRNADVLGQFGRAESRFGCRRR